MATRGAEMMTVEVIATVAKIDRAAITATATGTIVRKEAVQDTRITKIKDMGILQRITCR
jgi:hypothetical protein